MPATDGAHYRTGLCGFYIAFVLLLATISGRAADLHLEVQLDPVQARAGQSVYLKGVPESIGEPRIEAKVIAPNPADDEYPILGLRLANGNIEILVPLQPGGPDTTATLRLEVEGLTTTEPLDLQILPLAPSPGATLAMARTANEIMELEARRALTTRESLEAAMMSDPQAIPGQLIPTAIVGYVLSRLESRLIDAFGALREDYMQDPNFDPELFDRIIGASVYQTRMKERLEFARNMPVFTSAAVSDPDPAVKDRIATWFDTQHSWFVANAHAARPGTTDPWEKQEIKTAFSLDFWMRDRQELLKRTPPSTKPAPSLADQTKSAIKGAVKGEAKKGAEKLAMNYLEKNKKILGWYAGDLEKLKNYKKGLGKILGVATLAKDVFDTTIHFHDLMRIALLPSKLEDIVVELDPALFEVEDHPMGVPQSEGFGSIKARVTALSEDYEFTLSDAVRIFGIAASAAKMGADGGANATDTGDIDPREFETTLQFVNRIFVPTTDDMTKAIKIFATQTDRQRETARKFNVRSEYRDAGILFKVRHNEWRLINISDPEYSYPTIDPGSIPMITLFKPTPIRWGYRPIRSGQSKLWVSTQPDKFPGADSTGSAMVAMLPIAVDLTADKTTVRPKEAVKLECDLENVQYEAREWQFAYGSIEKNQRVATWTAPELGPKECRRDVDISCEATSRHGVRHELQPTRIDRLTVSVRKHGPEGILPASSRLNAGDKLTLDAVGGEGLVWQLVKGDGQIVPKAGEQITYVAPNHATRAVVKVYARDFPNECVAFAEINVGNSEFRYSGWLDGFIGVAEYQRPFYGPLEWQRNRQSELAAAVRNNAGLMSHVTQKILGIAPNRGGKQVDSAMEQVFSGLHLSNEPAIFKCKEESCFGNRMSDSRNLTEVSDFWDGSEVEQRVGFSHLARGNFNRIEGSVSIKSSARMLDTNQVAPVFGIRYQAETDGTVTEDMAAQKQGQMGREGGAEAIHTWGWLIETGKEMAIRADLQANASGNASTSAGVVAMIVLDDSALQPLPYLNLPVVGAEPKLSALDEKFAQMGARERAMMEQMLGPDFKQKILDATGATGAGGPSVKTATLTLPGPPKGVKKVTYYIAVITSFEVKAEIDGTIAPGALAWRGQGAGEAVVRLARLDKSGPLADALPGYTD